MNFSGKISSCAEKAFELNLQGGEGSDTRVLDRPGGTFTDVIAVRPDGHLRALKLLSENPEHYADAAVEGIRRILGLNPDEPIPTELIRSVKMGTTVATNALLERKGEPTVLVVNNNLRDVLRIGTQQRPHLFDLEIKLPRPIYDHVIEIPGRLSVEGSELEPLDERQIEELLRDAFSNGFRGVAVALMHGFRFPQHESRVAEIARKVGFTQISVSHEVSQLIKLVPRGETTVVDADRHRFYEPMSIGFAKHCPMCRSFSCSRMAVWRALHSSMERTLFYRDRPVVW